MPRRFDHIDMRVPNLGAVTYFYRHLLPALGFTEDISDQKWLQFSSKGDAATEFFGITEDPKHVTNEIRIAFWAESEAKVYEISSLLARIGALHVEGPELYSPPGYHAVFFQDPAGNRLEICHRLEN